MSKNRYVEVNLNWHTRLLHPKLVTLIVTSLKSGRVNVMPASWVTPTSVTPPLVTLALSPRRYTYEVLQQSREFTVNPVSREMLELVEYTGSVSGREEDKVQRAGIKLIQAETVSAPCIDGALACIECRVWSQYPAGDHVLVVGQVLKALVLQEVWGNNTYILEKAKPLFHVGGDSYVAF
ncbi:MAG: flavin reductase family protein [Infirmifilum sp.]